MRKLLGYAIASAFVLVASVALAKPPVPIIECGSTIAEPGNYRLMNDLVDCTENGILVTGSNITLDLKGHSISCDTNGGLSRLGGVIVWSDDGSTISNVTIKNGHVSDCSDGVLLVLAQDSKVKNVSSGRNLLWQGASGTGITVWLSENILVTKTHTYGNESEGIGVWDSTGTVIKHNLATDNIFAGISTARVDDTRIECNKVFGNETGVLLGPWSTGGLVKGNLAKWNGFDGISAWGWGGEEPWHAIPSGNTFRHNVSEENLLDHVELAYDFGSDEIFPHPDGLCLNRWIKNQYANSWGPDGCISHPVELDDDDVCALDDDD